MTNSATTHPDGEDPYAECDRRRQRAATWLRPRLLRGSEGNGVGREPGMSPSEFVTALYRGILARDPDPSGLQHYVATLEQHGLRPDEVVRSVAASEEATTHSRLLRRTLEARWQVRSECRALRRVYFLHIMKTGGTSLAEGLRILLPDELCLTGLFLDHLVLIPRPILRNAALISGHLPYETLDVLPRPITVCTIIRDPVERTLSHYWHLKQDPGLGSQHSNLSLEEFLESDRWGTLARNYQARQLVHRVGVARAWIDFSPHERLRELGLPSAPEHPLQGLFDTTSIASTGTDLEREALGCLDSIELVGVTERLAELVAQVAAHWGVERPPPIDHRNVANGRPEAGELPSRILKRIQELNAVDMALYEQARLRGSA